MVPKKNKLIRGEDFALIHRTGRFFSHGRLRAKIAKNSLEETRIGISVGIKFSPLAVRRNKLKRQLRSVARKHLSGIRPGFDMVLMAEKGEQFPDQVELEKDFSNILEKSGLKIT